MEQKIKLSSNIPITLPEKLSENQFGLGFLYPCGKGLELKDGQTWFEKVCLSLNKINSIVGFQNSNLKIPEYIAETTQIDFSPCASDTSPSSNNRSLLFYRKISHF